MKHLSQAIIAVGLAVVAGFLLTHDHQTAGTWLIVLTFLVLM